MRLLLSAPLLRLFPDIRLLRRSGRWQAVWDARDRLYRIDSEHASQESGSAAFAYQELKSKVEELCARMEEVQRHVGSVGEIDRRCAKLEVRLLYLLDLLYTASPLLVAAYTSRECL